MPETNSVTTCSQILGDNWRPASGVWRPATGVWRLATGDSSNRQIIPHEHQNRRLGDDEVLLVLEGDLDRRLTKKDRVVADLGLHATRPRLSRVHFPRFVIQAAQIGDWSSWSGRHDEPGL